MFARMSRSEAPGCGRLFPLAAECVTLFAGVPAAYARGWIALPVILLLIIITSGCWLLLRLRNRAALRGLLRTGAPKAEWRRILLNYAAAVPALLLLLWIVNPASLFTLALRHPAIWMAVMCAYPIASVLPQEFAYRVFFFERYRPLFGRDVGMILASAMAFSFAHIVFRNWLAVVLTFIGGVLFARSYQRTRSLWLVAVEHALYGCAIFTVGYGEFFSEGTLRLF
jgi:membrane protease YdiL (CAAX protease family)